MFVCLFICFFIVFRLFLLLLLFFVVFVLLLSYKASAESVVMPSSESDLSKQKETDTQNATNHFNQVLEELDPFASNGVQKAAPGNEMVCLSFL